LSTWTSLLGTVNLFRTCSAGRYSRRIAAASSQTSSWWSLVSAIFSATRATRHFRFSDYGKLTVIRRDHRSAAWPIVTRVTSAPRWLFFRLAIGRHCGLPDLYILYRASQAMRSRCSWLCTSRSPWSPTTSRARRSGFGRFVEPSTADIQFMTTGIGLTGLLRGSIWRVRLLATPGGRPCRRPLGSIDDVSWVPPTRTTN